MAEQASTNRSSEQHYDFAIIGSGPAGQKAAVQAAKSGCKVALIERDNVLGGSCVHRGTIPSKTLRESALNLINLRRNAEFNNLQLSNETELATLMRRLNQVLQAHDHYMKEQINRNGIERIHGRAQFVDSHNLQISQIRGKQFTLRADNIVIATGSYPRHPDNVPVDHEHIFDSDSILSMLYLPKTLIVLGGGVIASEYASIFQALGVEVTMIDRYPRPLGFLDDDLTATFVSAFEHMGGRWLGGCPIDNVQWDGLTQVVVTTSDGQQYKAEKLLCAAGRLANTQALKLENAGLCLNERGLLDVDSQLRTSVPNIYAAGDVIGPPSLASASMEQGRRASRNALNLPVGDMNNTLPAGIYGIPELSAIGLTETAARQEHGNILIGKAHFREIARGHISGIEEGMLKIICDPQGQKILGVMIAGEGATELIHIGQMAMLANADIDIFVESTFNFPTLAEAYRVAALAIIGQRKQHQDAY